MHNSVEKQEKLHEQSPKDIKSFCILSPNNKQEAHKGNAKLNTIMIWFLPSSSWSSIKQRSKKHLNKSLLYNPVKSTPSFSSAPKRQMINDALRNKLTSELEMKCFAKPEMFAPDMKECVEKKSQNWEFPSCEGGKNLNQILKVFLFFCSFWFHKRLFVCFN